MAVDQRCMLVVMLALAYDLWNRQTAAPARPAPKVDPGDESWYSMNLTDMIATSAWMPQGQEDRDGARVVDVARHLAERFVPSTEDAETRGFLQQCHAEYTHIPTRLMLLAKSFMVVQFQMMFGFSSYDAAAMANFQTCFVASSAQFRRLLGGLGGERPLRGLLDIGAGSGEVTAKLLEAMNSTPVEEVVAMEASRPLLRQLDARGYWTASEFSDLDDGEQFGVVALLNVLDRCDSPRALLEAAVKRVQPGGVLVVATVVPFCPKVMRGHFFGLSSSREPEDPLQVHPRLACQANPSHELATAAFAAAAFADLPLTIRTWTRVPYLSSGDFKREKYVLSNVVFVLERTE